LLKVDGTDSVIFRQERIGLGGQPFHLLKFRTMHDEVEDTPTLAEENDTRLTRYGKYLRRHHLDELPQLWNVLRGDMSFVGYRPERQFFINQIIERNPDYVLLYCSRPGITSAAAVHNGYTYTIDQMLRRLDMDLDYLRYRTLWTDLRIMFETLTAL
jgi:lipopolysaccharide/colanic/teichoic acid biosynthesis glycosyltransferase